MTFGFITTAESIYKWTIMYICTDCSGVQHTYTLGPHNVCTKLVCWDQIFAETESFYFVGRNTELCSFCCCRIQIAGTLPVLFTSVLCCPSGGTGYEQFVGYKTTFRLLNSVDTMKINRDPHEAGITTLRNNDIKVRDQPP